MAEKSPGGNNPYEHLLIYADGSIQPDKAGAGVVAVDRWGHIPYITNRILPVMTNNEAEYAALLLALETAAAMSTQFLEVRMDSANVVYQMTGRFSVKSPALRKYHQQACVLARSFTQVRYIHIPREHNALADALATEASAGRTWHTPERRI